MDITDWRLDQLPAMEPLKVAEVAGVLDRAADLIEAEGWSRCALYRRTGPQSYERCARGALLEASGAWFYLESENSDAWRRARRLASASEHALGFWLRDTLPPEELDAEAIRDDRVNIPDWNDHPGQSADSVVAALRGCAQHVRSGDARN